MNRFLNERREVGVDERYDASFCTVSCAYFMISQVGNMLLSDFQFPQGCDTFKVLHDFRGFHSKEAEYQHFVVADIGGEKEAELSNPVFAGVPDIPRSFNIEGSITGVHTALMEPARHLSVSCEFGQSIICATDVLILFAELIAVPIRGSGRQDL